jgi:uncharacterized membrane protein YphA (DoxX/SURF4 family)
MLSVFPDLFTYERVAQVLLRLVLGAVFILYGYRKISKHKNGLIKSAGFVELIAGAFVFVGFVTQIAAIVIVVDRIVSILRNGANENKFLAIAAAVSLILREPGFFAIDLPY